MLLSFVYSLPPVMFLPADLLMSMALLTSSNESTQDTTDTSTTPNTPRTQASLIMILFDCLLRSVVFMMPPIVIIALFAVFPTDQVAVALGCMTMIIPESIMICHSTYFYGCMVVMITQLDMGIVPADAGFWPGLISLLIVMKLYIVSVVSVKPESWASTFNLSQAGDSKSQSLLDHVDMCQPPPPYQTHSPSDGQLEKMEEAVELL